jgi:hypothetical protein
MFKKNDLSNAVVVVTENPLELVRVIEPLLSNSQQRTPS